MRTWPTEHVAKAMVYAHPGDEEPIRSAQERRLRRLADACHAQDREFLVELQAPPGAAYDERGVTPTVAWVYSLDIRPDWWKLPPDQDPASWKAVGDLIRRHDPHCRGMLVLGQSGGTDAISAAIAAAAAEPMVKGFAVGRGIFVDPARRWMSGELSDDGLVDSVAENYLQFITTWYQHKEAP